ncbi:MAG: hypothetical protein KDA28_11555, partial [Phycisphaerales bacterium]|nr:hypothetical protein [Phycisphaerales bacterium]
ATPQAAIAAAAQVNGHGDGGLLANPRFAAVAQSGRELYSLSFVDPVESFRHGYGAVSLMGSAVANLVRSPNGADREPGLLVPTYAELAHDVEPSLQYSFWDGETFRVVGHGDRSWLRSMAVQFGSNPAGGGGLMPIIMQAVTASQQRQGGMNGWGMSDLLSNEALARTPFGPVTPLISLIEAGRATR